MPARTRRPTGLTARLSGTPRLLLAVVLLVAGTLVALTATAPPATSAVLVAVNPIAAGAVVAATDVEVRQRPSADRPETALTEPAAAAGHRAVGAVARGEVLTAARVAPGGLTAGLAPDHSVAAVSIAAARAGVVGVGDRVRLLAAPADPLTGVPADPSTPGGDSTVTLADDARVLAVWVDPGSADAVATLVVDVDVGSASRLAVVSPAELVGVVVLTA